jgi:endoglucanase
MGNVDMTANEAFMGKYSTLSLDFIRETPLFYAEDIKFPLSTKGARIVDATGRRVKLAGGNWSGGHMCRHCVDGLECRPLRDLAKDIKYKFHMNCIRLTYSLQLFFDNNKVPNKYLTANPELIGKTSMEIFDYTIKILTEEGIMVILNNHTSTSQWCCSNDDGDGLWWSYQYPENMFFECA